MERRIRLTESDLHRIVKESVGRVLNEMEYADYNNRIEKIRQKVADNARAQARANGTDEESAVNAALARFAERSQKNR